MISFMSHTLCRILWLTLICCTSLGHSWSGCEVHIKNDISEPQMLILKPGYENDIDSFYLPDNDSKIRFPENTIVELACPGKNSLILDRINSNAMVISGRCFNGRFVVNDTIYPFSAFKCAKSVESTIRFTGNYCNLDHQGKEIEVGFLLPNRFIRHILICFNDTLNTTLYTVHKLSKRINASQKNVPRSHWMKGVGFDKLDLKQLYNSAQNIINSLVDLPSNSATYISQFQRRYLVKGHLTPKADFIYGTQQKLTFYYANSVPQWQVFNAGNWYAMERSVRNYISSKQLDLEVYTGIYQVQQLPHARTGRPIELYLSKDKVPVPRLLWKVLYNRAYHAGIVLIGVNNPYFHEDIICHDISYNCSWVKWDCRNVSLGCGYCCDVNDFRKNVTFLPDFRVTKLLD